MDIWKYFGNTHRDHVLCNPTSLDRLEAVLAVADLLPNGLFTDVPFLLGGALLGFSRGLPLEEHTEGISAAAEPPPPRRGAPADGDPGP